MKKALLIFYGIIIIAYTILLIYYSEAVSIGMINAVKVCLTVIIPSLYAFMVISGFIVSSNLYKILSKPFGLISKYIFKIPKDLFSVFLLSSVAGYPIGAKLLTDLYSQKKIDRNTAEKMLGYCYMGGPAFFCGVAGVKIYSSVKIGMLIFLCIFISNVIIAVLSGIKNPIPKDTDNGLIHINFSFNSLTESINSGGVGILKICGAILFFSSLISILDATGFITVSASYLSKISSVSYADCIYIIKSILEISNISNISPSISLIPIVAALLSFGGFCVIIQVEGIVQNKISTNIFYLYRLLSIFTTYICCKIVIYIFDTDRFIQAATNLSVGYRQISPMPSLFLLIMTILLLSNNYIVKSKKM